MKHKLLIIVFMNLVIFSCTEQSLQMEDTVWVFRYNTDIADSLIFKEALYISYSGESQLYRYGEYIIRKDTIYFFDKGDFIRYGPTYLPDEEPINTKGRAIISQDGKLIYLSPLRFENGQWIDTGIKFESYGILERVQ